MARTMGQPQVTVLGDLLDGLPREQAAVPVAGLALDSRQVRPGDVFLAVRGHAHDGRDYIAQAAAAGAVAVIADAPCDVSAWRLPVVAVEQLAQRLSEIAGRFFSHPSRQLNLIGVTGTNGKSSTVLMLAQLLEALNEPCGVIGTLGSGRVGQLSATANTTPDAVSIQSLLRDWVDAGAGWAAMEVSSHGLAQHRVEALQFRAALFTNLSQDHLDYHGSMAAYGEEKARLFRQPGLELVVLNRDDPFSASLRGVVSGCEVLDYSLSDSAAAVHPRAVAYSRDGISAEVSTPWGELALRSPLLGDFNLANLLAAVTALGGLGVAPAAIADAMAALQPIAGRMECLHGGDGLLAVIDYAHSPDALDKVLLALRRHCEGRLWCVFGCGGDRDRGKRPLMGAVAERLADCVVVTSDNPRGERAEAIAEAIVGGMDSAPLKVELDRRAAIEYALAEAAPEDLVLIAGKGHEDYQEQGGQRLPFSDVSCARLALAGRAQP